MIKTGYLKLNLEKIENQVSSLSLKKILQIQMLALITRLPDILLEPLDFSDIPLKPELTEQFLIYRSAIALKLAQQCSLTREILAHQIFTILVNLSDTNENSPNNLTVQVELIEQGWLLFSLDFCTIQGWLTILSQKLDCLPTRSPMIGITESFPAGYCQYAHARASALLRLAEQEKLLPLPHLSLTERLTPFSPSLAERSLLDQILRITDQLDGENTVNWLKVAHHLSESFLTFERHCRLFGDKNQPIKSFKWLLLINTRFLLQIILLTKLKIPIPDEL